MTSDALSLTFSALADPTRRAILTRLMRGPASVGQLAEPFEISLPAISRHLKVLSDAGLISREKDAQWRHCHLSAAPLRSAADWLGKYRQFWEDSFDALDEHLAHQKLRGAADKQARPRATRRLRRKHRRP